MATFPKGFIFIQLSLTFLEKYHSLVLQKIVRRCLGTEKPLQNHLQKGLEHKGIKNLVSPENLAKTASAELFKDPKKAHNPKPYLGLSSYERWTPTNYKWSCNPYK